MVAYYHDQIQSFEKGRTSMKKIIILLFALLLVSFTNQIQDSEPTLGGWTPINSNDADLAPIVDFAKQYYLQQNGFELGPLISAYRQLVAGYNYKLTFQSSQGDVTIVVFDQPWTHTRTVTSISTTSSATGGWTTLNTNDPDLAPIVKFAKHYYLQQNGQKLGTLVSAQSQIVAGINYKLTFKSSQGTVTIVVFDQPWTHTRKVTSVTITPSTPEDTSSTVGGWTPVTSNDADLAPIVDFARQYYLQHNGIKLGALISAYSQLVAGTNYKLTFKSSKGDVTIVVFDQPWTNTRKVTSVSTAPSTVGGWTAVSSNDADLAPIVDFARQYYLQQNGLTLGPLISAYSQLVAGYNYKLTFQSSQGDVTIVVFDQPWTNTREVTSVSTASPTVGDTSSTVGGTSPTVGGTSPTVGDTSSTVGGWTPVNSNDADLAPIVDFARQYYLQHKGIKLGALISAFSQLVAGTNYKLTFKSTKCTVTIVVFDQPWTNTREVTSVSTTPSTA